MASTLVCLHGFMGGPSSYDAVAASVVATGKPYQFWCPTLSGHACSGVTAGALPQGFGEEVARLAEDIRAAHAHPVTLVGYSMGGRLALGIAIAYPELVRSLILVSARRGLDSEREREDRRNNDERWARLLETRGLPEFVRQWDEQPLFASKRRLPSDVLRRDHERRLALDPLGLAWSLRHLGLGCQPSYEHEVEALRIPVTLITGGLDGKFRDLSDALAAKLPNARRVVVEGQGHALLLEAPTAIGQAIIEE